MPMTPEEQAEFDKMKADNKRLSDEAAARKKAEDEAAEKKRKEEEDEKGDLLAKAKKEKEDKENAAKGDKNLESALAFNMSVNQFVKDNKDILPDDFSKVLELAEKESYDTPKQKANAIRSGLIQSFFSVKDHNEALTENQKKSLADFMKLTKNGKEEKSHEIYENVFEPAFEMVKRLKKQEDKMKVAKSEGTNSSSYKDKLMKGSQEKYFGKRNNN